MHYLKRNINKLFLAIAFSIVLVITFIVSVLLVGGMQTHTAFSSMAGTLFRTISEDFILAIIGYITILFLIFYAIIHIYNILLIKLGFFIDKKSTKVLTGRVKRLLGITLFLTTLLILYVMVTIWSTLFVILGLPPII